LRPLPQADNPQQAVRLVIASNRSDGYTPTRFIQVTEDGYADDLLDRCAKLIEKGETLEYLASALQRYPTLLTLEDFVARFGAGWGLPDTTLEAAKARESYFDQLANGPRYS
jgi:hypothetical protein